MSLPDLDRRPPAPLLVLLPLVVVPLVVGGAVLRLWHAGESMWLDELHTAWCAAGDLAEVAPRARIGNQSPLYFWLQWLLVRAFGASEITLRLPSLIAGTLLPAAMFAVAWRWTASAWLGLAAAVLAAFDPLSIYYATEARPYALVQLLAVLHLAAAAEVARQPAWPWRAAFVVGAAALFYLHYTAALVVAAEIVVLVGWTIRRHGSSQSQHPHPSPFPAREGAAYSLRWLGIDAAIIAALWLPAGLHLREVFGRRSNWAGFINQRPLGEVFDVLPWSAAAGVVLAAAIMTRLMPQERDRESPAGVHAAGAWLALGWLLVPLALAWIATATDLARLLYPRYLVGSAPAGLVLAAMSVGFAPWRWSRWLVAGTLVAGGVLAAAVPLAERGRAHAYRDEDWRGATRWLNEQLPERRYPILLRSGLVESNALRAEHEPLLEDYCLLPVTSLYPLSAPRTDLVPLPSREPWLVGDDTIDFLEARGGAWLVVRTPRRSNADVVARRLVGRVRGLGFRIQGGEGAPDRGQRWRIAEARSFGGVHVYRIERR